MIYSDKQRRISAREVERLGVALDAAKARDDGQPWLRAAEVDALQSEVERIAADIAEYDMLKAGEITFAKSFALEGLPTILVQARIASGMTQTDLAKALGMKPQQVQRYEASAYSGASLARLVEISKVLGVHSDGLFGQDQTKGGVFSWDRADDIEWRRFPTKEMVRRGWFEVTPDQDAVQAVRTYFRRAGGTHFATALHRKKVRGDTSPNEYALLAWQARVLERARHATGSEQWPEFSLDDRWLPDLVDLTVEQDGVNHVSQLLADNGIVLVVEQHLPETYLDGAAMLDDMGRPVIGLTLRHDRLDNFWFVLFHELGHTYLHLMDGLRYDFFDDDGAPADDRIEREADAFALDRLIPAEKWERCLSRFAMTEEAVRLDATTLGVSPSIVAGRIRRERGNYQVFNNIIGQGHVRSRLLQ